jgi:hypothetical protein
MRSAIIRASCKEVERGRAGLLFIGIDAMRHERAEPERVEHHGAPRPSYGVVKTMFP